VDNPILTAEEVARFEHWGDGVDDLAASHEALRANLATVGKMCADQAVEAAKEKARALAAEAALEQARAECERLREVLRKYGKHIDVCLANPAFYGVVAASDQVCTCGLDDALASGGEKNNGL
jgi:hypothetical protein